MHGKKIKYHQTISLILSHSRISFYSAYHNVTTSFEYVLVGTLFALAKPVKQVLCNVTKSDALGRD